MVGLKQVSIVKNSIKDSSNFVDEEGVQNQKTGKKNSHLICK